MGEVYLAALNHPNIVTIYTVAANMMVSANDRVKVLDFGLGSVPTVNASSSTPS